MSSRFNLQDATGVIARHPTRGVTIKVFPAAPVGSEVGYAPGCFWINPKGAAGLLVYVNVGTKASASWAPLLYNGADSASALVLGGTNAPYVQIGSASQAPPQFPGGTVRCTTELDATTNTTLANVPGLSVNLIAGRKYILHGKLFTVSTVNGGLKVGFGGTATATSMIAEGKIYNTTTLNTSTQVTALGTLVSALVASDSVQIYGEIVVNAAGTLTVQMAQNTSHADTSKVLVGSYLQVIDVN